MKFKVFFILFFYSFLTFSQEYLDSLKAILTSKTPDSLKLKRGAVFFNNPEINIDSVELANCYHEYGKWFYKLSLKKNKKSNLKKAIFFSEKSLTLKEVSSISKSSLKKTLHNLGIFYYKLHNNIQAINYYQKIIDIPEVNDKTFAALSRIVILYRERGDYHKAITSLDYFIDLSLKDSLYRRKAIKGFMNKAIVFSEMGRRKYSKEIKENIIKFDSLLNVYSLRGDNYYSLVLNQLKGNRLLENGFYKEALPFFEKGLKNISKNDFINLAIVNNSIGTCYSKLRNYNNALSHLEKAFSYDVSYSPTYENLGDLYLETEEYQKGIAYYQKGMNIQMLQEVKDVYEKISLENLEEAKNKYYLLHHLIQKAKGWVQYYHYDNDLKKLQYALETFEAADKLIDIIRFESTEYKSKLFWREQGASLYLGAVEVCYLLKDSEKALYFMEKNKAILLLEDISNHQAIKNAKLPLDLANKEFQLKSKINTLESRLQVVSKNEGENVETVKRALYLSKRTYAGFIDSLVSVYPVYGKYKKRLPIISYNKVKKQSEDQNKFYLQYITNDDKGYGLLIGVSNSEFFEIENAKELPELIKKFQNLVTQKISTSKEQKQYHQIASTLFNKLIPKEVFQQIKGKEVIIIPDYRIQKISFETLTTSKELTSYFIKDATISYVYSLSHLENNNKIKRIAEKGFLAVAPVDFSTLNLPSLQYTLSEVNTTKSIFGGETLLKEQANKNNFLEKGSVYKGLHLATHAEVSNYEQPWIAFNDEKLSLQEIYGYKNEHELVTLSACKTSLGALQLGEGVMSLARGFFYGGAKSVISSLWASNDKSNEKIIVNFYKELNNGVSKSAALRTAKLKYLKNHEGIEASPYYWGGYMLIGDVSSVNLSTSSFNWNYVIVGLFILLIIIIVFFKRKALTNKK